MKNNCDIRKTLFWLLVPGVIVFGLLSIMCTDSYSAERKTPLKSPSEATCINNLRQLYMASVMYADDHGGNLPDIPYIRPKDGKGVRNALAAYIPNKDENYTCPTNPFKDIYLSSAIYGYSCYYPCYQDYNCKWYGNGARNWDSSAGYVTNGNTLFGDFVEDEIGLGRVGPSHRNKYGLQITTKGAIYFWYVVTAGQAGPWAEYPSGEDCVLR